MGEDARWHESASPKETTQMSRDVKNIGMDAHKEATVIAVRNTSGELMMESIVEFSPAPFCNVSTDCGVSCM